MVKLYVEGGGDATALRTACREGFTTFITKAGVIKRPRVVACGSRRDAYDSYCIAVSSGEDALLLVDSETVISDDHQVDKDDPSSWLPWAHLKARQGDGWDKPKNGSDTDCHLMTQVMESWFLADRSTLSVFFGPGYKENALPAAANKVESLSKAAVYAALKAATKDCKSKSEYGKGEHSFKILAMVDPTKITGASPWAGRFIQLLKVKMQP